MSDSLALYLGRAIRSERARTGLSQADLALRLGMSKATVSNLETGVRRVYMHEMPEICTALGVDLVTLLARADSEDLRALGLSPH